jgi:hypothetical protein
MKYICTKLGCPKEGVVVIEPSITIVVRNNITTIKEAVCPYCKSIRNEVQEEYISLQDKGVMIAEQFGSVNKNWSKPVTKSYY